MKTQTLDSMKGKYNSQLAEYLRLAELRKISQKESPTDSGLIEETERVNEKIMKYSVEEKTIVPSIKMLQKKRAERAESMKKTIINDKMKTLELESMISENFPNHSQPIGHTIADSSKHAAVRPTKNKTPVNPKRLAKKKRKVELERERRKGLTQLFDELDHWIDMGEKSTANPDARLNRFQKLPYYERTTAAIKCIEDLESSISFKETVIQSLQTRNRKLQSQLENFGDGTFQKSVDESGKNSEVDENKKHTKQEVELHKP